MSKIKEAFAKEKAFIPFITCGDPDLETTEKIIEAMAAAGADLIDLTASLAFLALMRFDHTCFCQALDK